MIWFDKYNVDGTPFDYLPVRLYLDTDECNFMDVYKDFWSDWMCKGLNDEALIKYFVGYVCSFVSFTYTYERTELQWQKRAMQMG